jgi:hypothetical protein
MMIIVERIDKNRFIILIMYNLNFSSGGTPILIIRKYDILFRIKYRGEIRNNIQRVKMPIINKTLASQVTLAN